MGVPKSITKMKKGNVKFVSSVDRVQYTLRELSRAALRDVGKLITNKFRRKYYSIFKRRKGKVGKYTQYWVRSKRKNPDLQVGLKPFAFYGGFQEKGTAKTAGLGLLEKTVNSNIADIIKVESQYLSALEDEAKALALIGEEDYEGGADGK